MMKRIEEILRGASEEELESLSRELNRRGYGERGMPTCEAERFSDSIHQCVLLESGCLQVSSLRARPRGVSIRLSSDYDIELEFPDAGPPLIARVTWPSLECWDVALCWERLQEPEAPPPLVRCVESLRFEVAGRSIALRPPVAYAQAKRSEEPAWTGSTWPPPLSEEESEEHLEPAPEMDDEQFHRLALQSSLLGEKSAARMILSEAPRRGVLHYRRVIVAWLVLHDIELELEPGWSDGEQARELWRSLVEAHPSSLHSVREIMMAVTGAYVP